MSRYHDIVISKYPPPSWCRLGCAVAFARMVEEYLDEDVLYVEIPERETLNERTETITAFVRLVNPREQAMSMPGVLSRSVPSPLQPPEITT